MKAFHHIFSHSITLIRFRFSHRKYFSFLATFSMKSKSRIENWPFEPIFQPISVENLGP